MQLMQVYSQKSIRTTWPRNAAMVSGCELSQVVPETWSPGGGNSGARKLATFSSFGLNPCPRASGADGHASAAKTKNAENTIRIRHSP